MVRRCPRCGNYAPVCLTYHHGEPYVEYRCGCGWSSLEDEDFYLIPFTEPEYESDNFNFNIYHSNGEKIFKNKVVKIVNNTKRE